MLTTNERDELDALRREIELCELDGHGFPADKLRRLIALEDKDQPQGILMRGNQAVTVIDDSEYDFDGIRMGVAYAADAINADWKDELWVAFWPIRRFQFVRGGSTQEWSDEGIRNATRLVEASC